MGQSARSRPAHFRFSGTMASWPQQIHTPFVMNSFPAPALVAALAALIALPFSVPAAGTLLFTAALGFMIHADYVQRHRRVRLPRQSVLPRRCSTRTPFRGEAHQLAA
jgi:hypothetical protein